MGTLRTLRCCMNLFVAGLLNSACFVHGLPDGIAVALVIDGGLVNGIVFVSEIVSETGIGVAIRLDALASIVNGVAVVVVEKFSHRLAAGSRFGSQFGQPVRVGGIGGLRIECDLVVGIRRHVVD